MSRWHDEIRRRLAGANLDPAREAEIAQELEQHLDDRYAELRTMGVSDAEAHRAAIDELRGSARMRHELTHLAGPAPTLPPPGAPTRRFALIDWPRDVRYALRMLRRSPGFALVAILTLAVGIGGTVAIFSAVYAALFRPLPLVDADRLVVPVSVHRERNIQRGSVPYADYTDWRERRDVFEQVAVFYPQQVDLASGETPERISALLVSAEYFTLMRVQPSAGRLLGPADHEANAPRVVVISDRLWRQQFGQAADVQGKTVRLAGRLVTIAGVAPVHRVWPGDIDAWLPIRPAELDEDERTRRDNMIFLSLARLRDGIRIEEARARVVAIAERVTAEHPESRSGWSSDVLPLREYIIEPELRLGMMVLLAGVGFVLLIACVNLANLLLARGADRAREIALRSALGASHSRLVRQMITESLVVAAAGGGASLLFAGWLLEALKRAAPPDLPMLEQMQIDGVALAVAASVTLGTAMLVGVLPAWTAATLAPADALREGGRSASAGRRARRLRDALVIAQIALAIVLLTGAGLMLRSFRQLLRVNPGVDAERVLAGRVTVPWAKYPEPAQRAQFYERLTDALAATPGVEAAAAASFLPAGGGGFGLGRVFLVEGQPEPPATTDHPAFWNVVTPEYFRSLGIRVIRGRGFTREDTAESRPVMLVNQTMARRVFGDTDPIGKRLRSWRDENVLREIVGVVSDVRYFSLSDEERSLVYVPHRQDPWSSMAVVVRVSGRPGALAGPLRHEVARLDPDVAVARIAPLSDMAAASIAPQRFSALLLSLFAAAAVLLAGIGVYGVMNYAVSQRTQELGIRLALGATPRRLFRLVLRRGLLLTAIGAAAGMAGGLAAAPVLRELLFGVQPRDPATILVVPLLLAIIAVAACVIPGLRASRVDPLQSIRQ